MSLFVECKPDETLAIALGVSKRDLEHAGNRARVCSQVSRRRETTGMIDEDPNTAPHPYMKNLVESGLEHQIRVLSDPERRNRLVIICPRFEDWLVESAKTSGLKMTDFSFESNTGRGLHREINHRLEKLESLVNKLLSLRNSRILKLQSLINPL
jgi:hypothetical protein